MNPKKLFPMIVTEKLAETKEFYTKKADFEIVHDMPDYLAVRYGGDSGPELGDVPPDVEFGVAAAPWPA